MNVYETKEFFEEAGLLFLFEKFQYQFYVTNLLGKSNPEILQSFLNCYEFKENEPIFFDEFAFHFRIFQNISVNNNWIH
ncbi:MULTISPECIES: hypothetical protein [Bacillaceae]|uniref:Uncharacterized protein n=1 Tax=Peribacillus huizhouensis TaxID=1501239 RepID=A0ABR6CRJ3_9BACI|nr:MULTISPECIES: hypothetical protein [Bacillaceae]MBA9027652.1 hypothetical protein [Peribacillus huizhouensis]